MKSRIGPDGQLIGAKAYCAELEICIDADPADKVNFYNVSETFFYEYIGERFLGIIAFCVTLYIYF
jgi:hypothetical protein